LAAVLADLWLALVLGFTVLAADLHDLLLIGLLVLLDLGADFTLLQTG